MVTQQSYTKDLIQKDPEVKSKRIPLTRDQSAMEPDGAEITPELIRLCQKAVGEVLWLTTRARPDIMFAVSRMGSSSTRAPNAVLAAALQLKGYLMATSEEGLMFNVKEGEVPTLTVFTDAGFAPDSQERPWITCGPLGHNTIFLEVWPPVLHHTLHGRGRAHRDCGGHDCRRIHLCDFG